MNYSDIYLLVVNSIVNTPMDIMNLDDLAMINGIQLCSYTEHDCTFKISDLQAITQWVEFYYPQKNPDLIPLGVTVCCWNCQVITWGSL